MTLAMLGEMENQGVLTPGLGRVPPETDTYAKPREDEVVVFKDFFPAGLRFPLDPAVVDIFARYGVFLHHMTPELFRPRQPFHVVVEDLPPRPDPGKVCSGDAGALPAEEHLRSWL